jgi:transposase-like protein
MNPQEQLCPNPECRASGKEGYIGVHSRKEQRYRCKCCGRTFSQTCQTAFYGLKKSPQLFEQVITLLAYGCPVQAIVAAFLLDERTVWAWLQRAGQQCQRVHAGEIEVRNLELGQIQADELKVKTYAGNLWMGLVMMVGTRLWLGGAVAPSRGKELLSQVFAFAQRAGRGGNLLIAVDGFNIYLEVIPKLFSQSWDWLRVGWQGWTQVAIVQTMKQKGGKRGKIDRVIAQGNPDFIGHMIHTTQGAGWINSAYIERLNATFRSRTACLVRDGRSLIRQPQHLSAWMWLVGSVYNWATYHQSLALALPVSRRKRFWLKRTPAIAAGLTDHRWTTAELLWWKHPTHYLLRQQILRATASPRYFA